MVVIMSQKYHKLPVSATVITNSCTALLGIVSKLLCSSDYEAKLYSIVLLASVWDAFYVKDGSHYVSVCQSWLTANTDRVWGCEGFVWLNDHGIVVAVRS
jgi:hypothetical protein